MRVNPHPFYLRALRLWLDTTRSGYLFDGYGFLRNEYGMAGAYEERDADERRMVIRFSRLMGGKE